MAVQSIKELRRHDRHKLRGQIQLSWTLPGGKTSALTGNCLDVSVYGMLIESPDAIPAGTQVKAQHPEVSGDAVVRYCRQYGPWFRIGLQFNGALMIEENVPNVREPLVR